eukprot:CAMPEP_0168613156 /NCGR_PEP_ID=MMETSP0449_2-20121227/3304_1 /TAXON_ID=1082188 /ORGANISM="Strombidium rassoulzadegani, Strain ras09" /LENGTH=233 /DNA_ID=CAMNT_0008653777 /DNA_START=131 /DNA_END=832 /DNA_ORIENTATION=-
MIDVQGQKFRAPQIQTDRGSTAIDDYYKTRVPNSQPLNCEHEKWAMVYHTRDYDLANQVISQFQRASKALGMRFNGDPFFLEIPEDNDCRNEGVQNTRNGNNYVHFINRDFGGGAGAGTKIVFVIIQRDTDYSNVKKCLDRLGLVSQIMVQKNIQRIVNSLGPISNILRQVNAKTYKDLFRLEIKPSIANLNPMIVALDLVNKGRQSIIGLAATNSAKMTQHFSQVRFQELHA